MSKDYSRELQVALLAVQRASILTQKVFAEKEKGTLSKDDKSPVTIGDFGAQALIIKAVKHAFPADGVVGEEEASSLRENKALSNQVWSLIKDVKLEDEASDAEIGGQISSEEEMLNVIDAGNSAGGPKGRHWALDPIDGTKGFLRGGQYAVCLGLIEDGEVVVGVLGCPNLPIDDSAPLTAKVGEDSLERGVLFSATIGTGAYSRPISSGGLKPSTKIQMSTTPLTECSVCESVEAAHSSQDDSAIIVKELGITKPAVRMDSQSKYGSIARGAGDIYLRLPTRKDYQEKIWDHAAGYLIVHEAGGVVTDVNGDKVDFSVGRTLAKNSGIVAATAIIHPQVMEVVKKVLAAKA
ncbi:hypothetical protein MMC25_006828 [Agyrium rufum]|nr:hypothetical protein [Agyrium rufum]